MRERGGGVREVGGGEQEGGEGVRRRRIEAKHTEQGEEEYTS